MDFAGNPEFRIVILLRGFWAPGLVPLDPYRRFPSFWRQSCVKISHQRPVFAKTVAPKEHFESYGILWNPMESYGNNYFLLKNNYFLLAIMCIY